MILRRIYGLVLERSDADFYHIFMPHDTDGKNRYKAENNGKFHLFSLPLEIRAG